MKVKESVEKYKTQSMHYLKNALHFIEVGDAEKASEFLWGSIAEAIKAVAASKGIQLKRHEDLRNYAMELAKVLRDESIRNTFLHAQSLHSNFYETGLLMEDIAICADDIRATLAKLFKLINREE
ncbi:MAG: PaREP1 family protein [Dehalococcoidia bacterium]